ncbi:hypothetical protein [Xanthocytophaga agilis]|uniref:Uncharacterized protein n=1 Tax=Xanthocytophaga agilis TaxID=3048010 RepID=A0AAE3R5M8_9BACT|nr:hypothetical protein [Xanthocytophaga agilis]MDJ1504224.1 hypothetical protein [Xanthocytophaga agilis]
MDDNFEATEEVVSYLLANYTNLMTRSETAASDSFSLNRKRRTYQPTDSPWLSFLPFKKYFFPDMYRIDGETINIRQVNALMKDGYDAFIQNWIKRIVTEELDKIHFNCCIRCGRLTRTPLAQQCRFCGYDWH